MIRLFKSFCCAAAFAVMLAGLSSCDTSSRQHRGYGPEQPEQPSRPGEGSESSNDLTLKYGFAEFWGQHHGQNTDDYLLYLYNGQFDDDGKFDGTELLVLDIVLPKKGDLLIKEGVYGCSEELGATYVFIPAYKDYDRETQQEYTDGSTLYLNRASKKAETLDITGGSITVKRLVSGYTVDGTVLVGSTEYTVHFKGGVKVYDMTQQTPSGDDEAFPGSDEFQLKAKAQYNGEVYEGSDDYTLFLYYGEYDDKGDFKTKGTEIVFEFLTKPSDGKSIASATYPSTADNFKAGYVLEGVEQDGTVYPSYVYRQFDNQGNFSLDLINSANVTVSRSGTDYVIDAAYQTKNGSYKVRYEGAIPFVDASGQGGQDDPAEGDVPKNVEMKNITRVVAEDWGQVWDGIECTDYRDWILYLYDKDAEKTKEYTCIEILTEEKYEKTLPEAQFSKIIVPDVNETKEFVPGVIIGGYIDKDNNAWGTWYNKGGTAYYAATKGTFDIKAQGDGYSFVFDFIDEDETYGGTFKGSYTGGVEFTKPSSSGVAARQAAGRMMWPAHAVSAPARAAVLAGGQARKAVGTGRRAAASASDAAPARPASRRRATVN